MIFDGINSAGVNQHNSINSGRVMLIYASLKIRHLICNEVLVPRRPKWYQTNLHRPFISLHNYILACCMEKP